MIIVALYYLGPRYALTVNIVRVLIAGLLFSGVFGAAYSMAGALLSFLVMVLLKKTGLFSITASPSQEAWLITWADPGCFLFSI